MMAKKKKRPVKRDKALLFVIGGLAGLAGGYVIGHRHYYQPRLQERSHAHEVTVYTEAGRMSDPANFGLELNRLEGHLDSVLRKEGLGEYYGSEVHMRGIDLRMGGPDGERLADRVRRILNGYTPFCANARVVIRDGASGAVIREFTLTYPSL